MAGFEKQGYFAASCEPFAEWYDVNGINNHINALSMSAQAVHNKRWNKALRAIKDGDIESADTLLGDLGRK